jgi:hypothetical protein
MSSLLRFGRFTCAVGLAALAIAGTDFPLRSPDQAMADPSPAAAPVEIGAHYSITFNGFNIGDVRTEQRITGRSYVASSDVEISALLGAVHWKGVTRAAGTLSGGKIRPSGFNFEYDGNSRSGLVRLGFEDGAVNQLTALPETVRPPDLVPLAPAHLKAVIDPLSALVALSRPGKGGPCGRKLQLFDGKQRFDVGLTAVRREMIASGQGAAPVEGLVCRVKYTPIGGYRNNEETRSMAQSSGIEVAFRPVAQAGLWLPFRVALPTIAGSVWIEATRFDIRAAGGAEVALVD